MTDVPHENFGFILRPEDIYIAPRPYTTGEESVIKLIRQDFTYVPRVEVFVVDNMLFMNTKRYDAKNETFYWKLEFWHMPLHYYDFGDSFIDQ